MKILSKVVLLIWVVLVGFTSQTQAENDDKSSDDKKKSEEVHKDSIDLKDIKDVIVDDTLVYDDYDEVPEKTGLKKKKVSTSSLYAQSSTSTATHLDTGIIKYNKLGVKEEIKALPELARVKPFEEAKIYPNPALPGDQVVFSAPQLKKIASIVSMNGVSVNAEITEVEDGVFHLNNLPSGVLIISGLTESNQLIHKTLVVH